MREGYKKGGKTEGKSMSKVPKAKQPMTAGSGSGPGRLQKIGKDTKK